MDHPNVMLVSLNSFSDCRKADVTFIEFFFRLSKSGGGSSGVDEPSFAEAMAAEYRKYQEEHGITDDELEEFGE